MSALDVLVAEDDEDTRTAVVRAVTDLDFPCRGVCDGGEALEEYRRRAAAIVLTDWRMPRLDGVGLCAALKKEPLGRRASPYVILMTLGHEPARLAHAVRAGVDGFLQKPFELDELEMRLLTATRRMQARRVVTG